jgi:hypothetical protein
VLFALLDESQDMVVVELVENHLPLPARGYEPERLEEA